ncbi:MAG: zinc-binding alcohol dehydrogenase [Anaerolineales bacterium]|nr:zinc-binding alcohol dehydrogenase [Anaerolineales bacterium]
MPASRQSVWFTAPYQVEVRTEALTAPGPGQALVSTLVSAISPGTEMLVYRGQFPAELPLDATIRALAGPFTYPVRYGYACVGRVAEVGPEVDPALAGRLVFAFQPHASAFVAPACDLFPLPEGCRPEAAAFLPSMETAVNFLLDGAPVIGERVAVLGQGVVGLLTTALLARLPLAELVAVDGLALRRDWALRLGARAALTPADDLRARLEAASEADGADLIYELSGAPAALDQAIAAAGFAGRIVVGSWYGQKRHPVDLGGRFHRGRLRLISSQVSTLTPDLLARWTKARRLAVAWRMLMEVQPEQLVTHRCALAEAPDLYALIDRCPEQVVQALFQYPA